MTQYKHGTWYPIEEWRDVIGWEGFYQISSTGRLRSVNRTVIRKNGTSQFFKSKICNQPLKSTGYPAARLSDAASGRRIMPPIHRLVAQAFIPNPLNLPEVNHKDGIKTNPTVENLEWVTSQQNRKHAWDIGLRNRSHLPIHRGIEQKTAKLNDDAVRDIRLNYLKNGKPLTALAKKYGVEKKTIYNVLKNKTWKHVSSPPPPKD